MASEPTYKVLSQEDAEQLREVMAKTRAKPKGWSGTLLSTEEMKELARFCRQLQKKYDTQFLEFFEDCKLLEATYFPGTPE